MLVEIENGLKIAVKVTNDGKGETILFASGSIFNFRQYDMVLLPFLRKLLRDRYTFIQYDYVGIGESSPLEGDFEFQTIAEQQLQLLDALGLEQVHLFGYSKGALINQLVAAKSPDRIKSMAAYGSPNLADPNSLDWSNDEFNARVERLKQLRDIWHESISGNNYGRVYDTVFLPTIFRNGKLSLLDRLKNFYIKRKLQPLLIGTKVEILYKLFKYYTHPIAEEERERYVDAIRSIQAPTLLMHGTADEIIPISASRLLNDWIPNSMLIELNGYRHSEPMLVPSKGKMLMVHYADFLGVTKNPNLQLK